MGERAIPFRAAGWRRHAGGAAVIVVAAVIALAGTACTAATSAPLTAGRTPHAVIVLQQGADNGNGDIFITPTGSSRITPTGSSRVGGATIWELGGKQSTFKLKAAPGQVLDSAGEIFAYQHDPEAIGNDEYTLFDDEYDGISALLPYSRVVTVKLDLATKVATLVKSVEQPDGLVAAAEGSAQTTRNGDLFVGWGSVPFISEFSPSGQLLFNAQLPDALTSYRAYRLPWHPAG